MVDFLIALFLATLIVALFTTRLYRLFVWYSLNSFMLGCLALYMGYTINDRSLLLTGFATILIKSIAIPYALKNLSAQLSFERSIPPQIKAHFAIILVPAILVFTFYLAQPLTSMIGGGNNYVAISISSLFLALLLMIEHDSIAPKIIGFLSVENALFLLGVSATEGMPMLVELGIFFDLLMAIVVINILFKKERIDV